MKQFLNSFSMSVTAFFLLALTLSLLAYFTQGNKYISFSDTAKFADVARGVALGDGYHTNFKFYTWLSLDNLRNEISDASGILPAYTIVIATFFYLFGVSDFVVILVSMLSYALVVLATYLLAVRVFDRKVGLISALVVAFDKNMLLYSISGASEPFFMFLILATFLSFLSQRSLVKYFGVVGLFLLYFTKFQSLIYIFPLIFLFFWQKYKVKNAVLNYGLLLVILLIVDKVFFRFIHDAGFIYSISSQTKSAVLNYTSASGSASAFLRGGETNLQLVEIFKKIFYNLYNFYKLLPNILNPYVFIFFLIELFRYDKNRFLVKRFKVVSLLMVLLTFLVTAISIPFYRYIHPVIPIVYIIGSSFIVWLLTQIDLPDLYLVDKSLRVTKAMVSSLFLSLVIVFVSVGNTTGFILLDSRFEKRNNNIESPPVYFNLAQSMKENTNKDDIVLTNLDTWGSWYGERKTVWFPLEPKQIVNNKDNTIPFNAIYLTSYLMDDENYKMSDSWKQIFENPSNPKMWTCDGCDVIANQFYLKGIYNTKASETYEKQEAKAILLLKK